MGAWSVRSRLDTGRSLTWDGESWRADELTAAALQALPHGPFGPAPLTVVGPVYQPRSPNDEITLFLNSVAVLPGGVTTEGDLPTLPQVNAAPTGAVT